MLPLGESFAPKTYFFIFFSILHKTDIRREIKPAQSVHNEASVTLRAPVTSVNHLLDLHIGLLWILSTSVQSSFTIEVSVHASTHGLSNLLSAVTQQSQANRIIGWLLPLVFSTFIQEAKYLLLLNSGIRKGKDIQRSKLTIRQVTIITKMLRKMTTA